MVGKNCHGAVRVFQGGGLRLSEKSFFDGLFRGFAHSLKEKSVSVQSDQFACAEEYIVESIEPNERLFAGSEERVWLGWVGLG